MKPWRSPVVTRVAHMTDGLLRQRNHHGGPSRGAYRIRGFRRRGESPEAKSLTQGEVIDCAVMNVTALRRFYAEQIAAAKADNALFSLHLKCTMMKVSDPIMFGHCVAEYFGDACKTCRRPRRDRRQREQRTGRCAQTR
jgi:isocitrate dehydrogenase